MRLKWNICMASLAGALLLAGCSTEVSGVRFESTKSSSSVKPNAAAPEAKQKQQQKVASKNSARSARVASLQARGVKPTPKSNSKLSTHVDRRQNPTAKGKIAPKGSYLDLKDGVIGGGKTVVLFFHAPLSPKSESDDKMLRVWYMGTDRPELSVYKVDFNSSADLRKQYNVKEDHTYVKIDPRGRMLQSLFSPSANELRDFLSSPYPS